MRKTIIIILSLTAMLLSVTALVLLQPWGGGLETEVAVLYTAEETETVKGVMVRSERRVDIPGSSSVQYLLADGERAAKNGLLAKVYQNTGDAESSQRAEELQAELDALRKASASAEYASASALSLEAIEARINGNLSKLSRCQESDDLSMLFDLRSDLTELLNKRHVYLKEDADFSERMNDLKNQISQLKSSVGSYNRITAPVSGYFYSYSDGLETLSPANLTGISPGKIDTLTEQASSAALTSTAKLVTEYRWYLAFALPREKSIRLTGKTVQLRFPSISNDVLTANIEQLVNASAGNPDSRTACVLSSIDATSKLCEPRIIEADLILSSRTGIKISTKAIRTGLVEGQEVQGVYVLKGTRLTFKQIQPLTVSGSYTICADTQKSGWLTLYDEIVTRGKDLYDGKIVR